MPRVLMLMHYQFKSYSHQGRSVYFFDLLFINYPQQIYRRRHVYQTTYYLFYFVWILFLFFFFSSMQFWCYKLYIKVLHWLFEVFECFVTLNHWYFMINWYFMTNWPQDSILSYSFINRFFSLALTFEIYFL